MMERFFISGTNADGLKEIKISLRDYVEECGHRAIVSGIGHFGHNIPDAINNCILEVRKCTHFILLLSKTAGNWFDETKTITEAEFYEAYERRDICKILVFVKDVTLHEYSLLQRLAKNFKSFSDTSLESVLYADTRIYKFIENLEKLTPKPHRYSFSTSEDIKKYLSLAWELPPEQELLYAGTEIYTENIYKAYQEAAGKKIYSYIATWPILPDKLKENESIKAENWVIMGPVTKDRMAGVLWRMIINNARSRNGLDDIILLHREISGTKFIITGDDTILVPIAKDPEERTKKHIIRKSQEEVVTFTNHFFELAQDAIPVEEKICKILRDDVMVDCGHIELSLVMSKLFDHWEKLGVKNIESIDRVLCREVIWECIKSQGGKVGLSVSGGHSDPKCIVEKRKPKRAASDHRLMYLQYQGAKKSPPPFRVVVTNRCNLRCEYCPPDNENYPTSKCEIDIDSLCLILDAATEMGFKKFCFTGGEPLLHQRFLTFLTRFINRTPNALISLSTNGTLLTKDMLKELKGLTNFTLKVSLDTLERDMYKKVCGDDYLDKVQETIEYARNLGIRVGLNFVVRKQNKKQFSELLNFARINQIYLKVLDLNWYSDIGKRKVDNNCSGDTYWERNYQPLDEVKSMVAQQLGPLRKTVPFGGYGIPMWETEDQGGFFVRIKDWREGAYYSDTHLCRLCEYFLNRKCHEGIYQLTLTSELKLKVCRHRPDLAVDLSESVQESRDRSSKKPIKDKIEDVLGQYFFSSKLL